MRCSRIARRPSSPRRSGKPRTTCDGLHFWPVGQSALVPHTTHEAWPAVRARRCSSRSRRCWRSRSGHRPRRQPGRRVGPRGRASGARAVGRIAPGGAPGGPQPSDDDEEQQQGSGEDAKGAHDANCFRSAGKRKVSPCGAWLGSSGARSAQHAQPAETNGERRGGVGSSQRWRADRLRIFTRRKDALAPSSRIHLQ